MTPTTPGTPATPRSPMTPAAAATPRAPRRTVLTGARVVLPGGVAEGCRLTVEGSLIASAAPAARPAPGVPGTTGAADTASAADTTGAADTAGLADAARATSAPGAPQDRAAAARESGTTIDLTGHWIVPGFVDLHVHGGGGASFSAGTAEEALRAVGTHRRHGTTTMVASTVTGDLGELARQAGVLAELVEQGELAGIHFEGPFIARNRCGAHEPALLRDPEPAAVRRLLDAARGTARMLTLAPELPGGQDTVRLLADRGVIAAIGHTDATYEMTREAIRAGATVATHLFNAMPPLAHRAPGPIAALLEDERITVELINDGTHLHPSVLRLAFAAAGPDRVALITDAMGAAGMGDGTYPLGPLTVEVSGGVARLSRGGSIAGSTLTLDRAFRRAMTVDRLPVTEVVRAISATPARLLGMSDRIGSIEAGKDADLVVLDADWAVAGVMRKGKWVVDPQISR